MHDGRKLTLVLNTEFPITLDSQNASDDDESISSSRPTSPISSTSSSNSLSRKTFYVDCDYELFHIVLFYLYTERILFTNSSDIVKKSDIPATTDAEGIYAISHRF